MALAFVQSQFMRTVTPFADYDLLIYMLKVPLSLRRRKRIIDELLKIKNPNLFDIKNCSSREYFYHGNDLLPKRGLRGRFAYYRFRILNALSVCLSFLTEGRYIVTNPFQTEELDATYRRLYNKKLRESVKIQKITGLLTQSNLDISAFCKDKLREGYIEEKYQLINLARLIS